MQQHKGKQELKSQQNLPQHENTGALHLLLRIVFHQYIECTDKSKRKKTTTPSTTMEKSSSHFFFHNSSVLSKIT